MIADIMNICRDRIIFDTTKPKGIFQKSTDNSHFLSLSKFQYTPFGEGLEKTIQWFSQICGNNPKAIRTYSKAKLR
jgi:GDP-L-fucose synthase